MKGCCKLYSFILFMSDPPYTPLVAHVGKLNYTCDVTEEYDATASGVVPADVSEILVYTFVTVKGEGGPLKRGYYEISTTVGDETFAKYMNVAFGDHTVIDAVNVWLPMGDDGKLRAKLICDNDQNVPPVGEEWSDVYIIGYKY